jgi:hypothetical protein
VCIVVVKVVYLYEYFRCLMKCFASWTDLLFHYNVIFICFWFLNLTYRFFLFYSSWSNRVLAANDFGAIQVNIADIDPQTGVYTKTHKTFALSGAIRAQVSPFDIIWFLKMIFLSCIVNLG